jgi:large subunit ribosomal protein L25
MSKRYEVRAEARQAIGGGAGRQLRRAGKVPAVIYGAGRPAQPVTLDAIEIGRNLATEAFHTALLEVKVGGVGELAILRDVQMHPFRPQALHVDFQRVHENEKLHIAVPLHFIGADVCPGVKLQGGILSHLMNNVDIACLPRDLPEYLEVDVSQLTLNQTLHLADVKLPEGVESTALAHGENHAVAAVQAAKVIEEAAPAEAAPAEAAAAAPAAGGAQPAAAAKGAVAKGKEGKEKA